MAAFHGKGGSATFAGGAVVGNLLSWSIDITADIAEITDMGDNWKSRLSGFKDWSATLECLTDSTGTGGVSVVGGAAAALVITAASGDTYTGNAICTGITSSADANDAAKVSFSFVGADDSGVAESF